MRADAYAVSKLAEQHTDRLERASHRQPDLTPARRLARRAELLRQLVVRKFQEIVHDHWDIGVFDVVFGSLKAFGIYPALYFSGLGWTIPLLETTALNTQVWTAGYLFARQQILSQLGVRRYGYSLNHIEALRDRMLGMYPRDARHVHSFDCNGTRWTVRIRRSRVRDWWERRRGRSVASNVLLQTELRSLVSDLEFLFLANPLRTNPYLYEKILLLEILRTPTARAKLLKRALPEENLNAEGAELSRVLGEAPAALRARVLELGNGVTTALFTQLGSGSTPSLGLRWLQWAYQRQVYRELGELLHLERRLLADLLDGCHLADSPRRDALRCKQAELRFWINRAAAFSAKACRVRSESRAQFLLEQAIEEARAQGLSVRLARAAAWLGRRLVTLPDPILFRSTLQEGQ